MKKKTDWRSRNVNCSEDTVNYSVADAAYSKENPVIGMQNAHSRCGEQLSEVQYLLGVMNAGLQSFAVYYLCLFFG